jgi:hypothetical protein
MADDVPFASVTIDGVDMAANVESIDVEDHERATDRARVVLDDTKNQAAQIVREQSVMQVTLGWTSEKAFIFEGVVVDSKVEAQGAKQQRVTVTAYDLSHLMTQGTPKKRYFDSGQLSDALKALVASYSSSKLYAGNIVIPNDPTFSSASPLAKPEGMCDLDFIQKLADQYRCRAFVEVNNNQSKFYFVSETSLLKGDPMGVLHYCPGGGGEKLTEFNYRRIGSGAAQTGTATVTDPATGNPVTQTAPAPAPEGPLTISPGGSKDPQLTQAADVLSKSSDTPDTSRPTPIVNQLPSDPDKANRRIQPDPTRIVGFTGDGTAVGTIKLRAKGKVTIKGIAPWAEGDWYVHKVNHLYTRIVVTNSKLHRQDRSTYQTKFNATR